MDIRLLRVLRASFVFLVHISGAFAANMQVGNASVKCIERERQSLLALKQRFVDLNDTLSSWGYDEESQKECCNWYRVGCDRRGHVIKLDLAGIDLEGTINSSLAELHYLKYLDLSGNNFNLIEFPKFITSLTHLKYLYLSDMNLKRNIPYELGDLFRLEVLDLSRNQLEGALPKSLGLCRLKELYLDSNCLSGQLDDFVRTFSCANQSLQILNLQGNQLNGTLSDSIGQLSSLEDLSVAHNSLKGVISETHFLGFSNLRVLDLSFNHLVFNVSPDWVPPFQMDVISLASCKLGPTFPRWLQSQKNCYSLDISSTEIYDTIPSWFWDLPFEQLNLSHNHITGELPNLSLSGDAFQIDLNSNLFEGPIPSTFSKLIALDLSNNKFTNASSLLCPNMTTSLTFLDLSNNHLSGLLPDCWTNFMSLAFLNVANNSLSGKIPTSMGSLIEIQALHLGNNRFEGEIPFALSNCTELTTFDVAHNNLSGLIPSWIGDALQNLRILILRSNMFVGSLPSNICHLSQVQVLDFSMNSISGTLPKCLNNLSALASQEFFDANITYFLGEDIFKPLDSASLVWKGKVSKYQSTLGLVKSVDLSNNMFIGEIPSEIMDLVGLVSLNISRNKISGAITPTIGYLKSLDILDLSRNHLSGRIPFELSHIDRLSVMDLSYNNLSGEIPHGTQLQSFDASAYVGNAKLCGDPLPKCPAKQIEDNHVDANFEEDEQFFDRGFFISLSFGFSTGFWGVCSLLLLKDSWRYAYFKLMSDLYDKLYVLVAISVAKLHKRNNVST